MTRDQRHSIPADATINLDDRNLRVKVEEYGADPVASARAAIALAEEQGFGKVWGFAHPDSWSKLEPLGYVSEGELDGYYADAPGIGASYFLSKERAISLHAEKEDAIVREVREQGEQPLPALPEGYVARPASREDCAAISELLTTVFKTYPTPIDTAEAIAESMDRDVHYTLIDHNGRLISAASADVDRRHLVAEMTDCATLPDYRGQGLMSFILAEMERDMRLEGLRSVFTLARAISPGINKAFGRRGYAYKGRFVNNCHISGNWEDMNLWVKPLR